MSRTFVFEDGNRVTCATAEEAHSLGYETGAIILNPRPEAGPYLLGYADPGHLDEGWVAYNLAMTENNAEWLRGFDEGRAAV